MKRKQFFLILLISMIYFSNKSFAQTTSNDQRRILVSKISKFLADQNNISSLKNKDDIYTFNLRITVKKRGNRSYVSEIISTDSIAYKIFPNYLQMKKFDFSELLKEVDSTVVIIPILIVNNPKYGQNPNENNIFLSSNTLTNTLSSLIYPDLLQTNVSLFPLFRILRSDVE